MLTSRRIDAHDPQPPELPLTLAPVALGVLQSLLDSVFGYGIDLAPTAPVSLGLCQYTPATPTGGRMIKCAWHGYLA